MQFFLSYLNWSRLNENLILIMKEATHRINEIKIQTKPKNQIQMQLFFKLHFNWLIRLCMRQSNEH